MSALFVVRGGDVLFSNGFEDDLLRMMTCRTDTSDGCFKLNVMDAASVKFYTAWVTDTYDCGADW